MSVVKRLVRFLLIRFWRTCIPKLSARLRTLGRITESVLADSLHIRDAITATIGALISPSVLKKPGLPVAARNSGADSVACDRRSDAERRCFNRPAGWLAARGRMSRS